MELTPPVAYRMSLTAAEVEELLLSIYTKIPADTIRTSLDSPDDETIPTTKAVADAIAVINADLEQLGALALLDSIDLGSTRVTGTLPIGKGGTGAMTVEQAQQNLGIVVESAIQAMIDASIPEIQSVDLGSPQATGILPLSKGGTGAMGASQARANLQVWSSGQSEILRTDMFASLRRSYAEANYTMVPGSFEIGGTVGAVTDVLLHEATGIAYKWSGVIPGVGKIVPPGSTPTPQGTGGWISVADEILRSDLAFGGAEIGGSDSLTVGANVADAIYASELGLVAGTDYTALFNGTLAARVESSNIRRIALDTGDIKISAVLAPVYSQVTFEGPGKIITTTESNVLISLRSDLADKDYSGLFNSGLFDGVAVRSAIHVKRKLRVVLLGDSIAVSSDYNNRVQTSGSQYPAGINNADMNNAFGRQLYNELCAMLPHDVEICFYSRSVAGRAYADIASSWESVGALWSGREQVTAGKSWRDCVLDLKPDLVIHEMGMNQASNNYLNDFYGNWYNYLTAKGKQGSFDQAIVTTPNPNFDLTVSYGDFRDYTLNADKFWVQQQQRALSRVVGYSLIDVAACSYIKRFGFDPRYCGAETLPQTPKFASSNSNTLTLANGSGIKPFRRNDNPLFGTYSFTLNPSVSTDTAGFGCTVAFGNILVQFVGGQIKIFLDTYGPGGAYAATLDRVLAAGGNHPFTVSVMPNGVFLSYGDRVELSFHYPYYMHNFNTSVENSSAIPCTATVVLGDSYGAVFPQYNSQIYGEEMFGDGTTGTGLWGGGVNHPSSRGLTNVYLPPLREFISECCHPAAIAPATKAPYAGNDDLMFVGRVERVHGNQAEIFDLENGGYASIKIFLLEDAWGYSVDNRFGGVIYVDEDYNVFAKKSAKTPLGLFKYSGSWASTKQFNYGGVAPFGYPAPESDAFVAITYANGIYTAKGSQVLGDASASKTIPVSLPAGSVVLHASGQIGVSASTNGGFAYDDKVQMFQTWNFISYYLTFSPGTPSDVARVFNYEYSYSFPQ